MLGQGTVENPGGATDLDFPAILTFLFLSGDIVTQYFDWTLILNSLNELKHQVTTQTIRHM